MQGKRQREKTWKSHTGKNISQLQMRKYEKTWDFFSETCLFKSKVCCNIEYEVVLNAKRKKNTI